ncbi:hypothetical protein AFGD_001779 [Aspergillus flavus]|nr:hypothetical protein AFGD_001779 [Aspergillus flavus]
MTRNFKDYSYDGNPHCYICGYTFHMVPYDWRRDPKATSLRKCDGVVLHNAEDVEDLHLFRRKAWWAVHRMNPVRTKCVSEANGMALEQADRRKLKSKRCQSVRKSVRQAGTCKPPVEILYMIANCLPSQAIANMEKAWGFRFGNTFWYSRIPTKVFHEVEDVADEDLDWQRLCLKLERRLEKSGALNTRRYLLKCLDEILRIVKTLGDS